jgi:hypothetical protein
MHQMLLVLQILLQCLSLGTDNNFGFAKSPLPQYKGLTCLPSLFDNWFRE